ncbi:hypothetical protein BC941DRAFT_472666 [Chlamydoabsidia padenii]|nr:hypothetical protein BC941DRAFT_472666 [Chlamydoabsidia padenii]
MAIPSNPTLVNKYLKLEQSNNKIQVEYLWIDNDNDIRSKARTLTLTNLTLDDIPEWTCDGFHTDQAPSDLILHPVALFDDPFRPPHGKLVLCDTYLPDGTPHSTNHRYQCQKIVSAYAHHQPLFGIEQEYMMIDPHLERPLGWPKHGFPNPEGKHYCGIGANVIFGRHVMEAHYRACLYAGIQISGANVEVAPGQYEFQVGPCDGIAVADQLWVARYLLDRVAEDAGIGITLHPKPVNDWNGAGAHTNYSTRAMRSDDGLAAIEDAIERMSLRHFEHIAVYGEDNDLRLTGHWETGHIGAFSYGVGNRGASIRIPHHVAKEGKGYMEDRRPASNMDPYRVTSIIIESTLSPIPLYYN